MNKVSASYKGLTFEIVIDGAGLDIVATDEASLNDIRKMSEGIAHELFVKVFDYGYHNGLEKALLNAGAVVKENAQ